MGARLESLRKPHESPDILFEKVEQVMELAEKFERGFWELNQTSESLTSLVEDIF